MASVYYASAIAAIRGHGPLTESTPRVRDLRLGPDGFIDLLTDERAGALLRMEPVKPSDPRPTLPGALRDVREPDPKLHSVSDGRSTLSITRTSSGPSIRHPTR
jgi:hypothetical protein